MAIRAALGASRVRVIRQLLNESVMVVVGGRSSWNAVGCWVVRSVIALGKDDIPRAVQVGIDWRVLGFTRGISLLRIDIWTRTAFHSSKTELVESLKEGGRGTSEGARRNKIRSVLVVGELAIAVVLLVGAGLLMQSLWRLQKVSSGLQPENVLTFNVMLPEVKYKSDKQSQFFIDLKTRLESTPGTQSASVIYPLPLSGDRFSISFETKDGRCRRRIIPGDLFTTGVGYFRTMGIPLIKAATSMTAIKTWVHTPVIIITETFHDSIFRTKDPIGTRIHPGISSIEAKTQRCATIVGRRGRCSESQLSTESRPGLLRAADANTVQARWWRWSRRRDANRTVPISRVTKEVATMDQDIPLFGVKRWRNTSRRSGGAALSTTLLSIFAGVALVLTIVGLYGVMSYSVAQRTNETRDRLALARAVARCVVMIVKRVARC